MSTEVASQGGGQEKEEEGNALTIRDVVADELKYVLARREIADSEEQRNIVKNELIGLAFSGGGIRSATFGLGVLEGLKGKGLLEHVDYLSTVSGGGYIGGWLSACCRRAHQRDASSWLSSTANWTESVDHLRRHSNYLSPLVGFLSADTWSMIMIWMRNAMLVQASVIAALAALLMATRVMLEFFEPWPSYGDWRWSTVALFTLVVAGIAVNLRQLSRGGKEFDVMEQGWQRSRVKALLVLVSAGAFAWFTEFKPFDAPPIDPDSWQLPLLQNLVMAALILAIGYNLVPAAVHRFGKQVEGLGHRSLSFGQGAVQSLIVLPTLLTGFLVAAVLWGQPTGPIFGAGTTYGEFLLNEWRYWPFPLMIAVASLWIFAGCSLSLRRGNPELDDIDTSDKSASKRGWLMRAGIVFGSPLPAIAVLYLCICAILLLQNYWRFSTEGQVWHAVIWSPALVLMAFSMAILALIGVIGRSSRESVREWWSRFAAWLTIYGLAWLVFATAAIYGPALIGELLRLDGSSELFVSGGWLLTIVAGLFAGGSSDTDAAGNNKRSPFRLLKRALAAVAPFLFFVLVIVLVATALHLILLAQQDNTPFVLNGFGPDYWYAVDNDAYRHLVWVFLGALGLAGLLGWRIDINVFNLNAFYRNRLNRCYLGAARFKPGEREPQRFTGLDEKDDIPIGDLDENAATGAPYHIINCALNLGGSSDLSVHTRHSASFIISPYATGSGYVALDSSGNRSPVGYRPTKTYAGAKGYPTLGQAMSISGAAANPNMGYNTSAPISILLTLFNARLGWWFPNPRKPPKRSAPSFSLKYLACELLGLADDSSPYLNVSDGGHFENLGAYELVRRKCRVIVISDAECDPNLQCEGLARLIRMCRVDFGVEIDIDVSGIRRRDGAWSRERCAVGTINYGDDSTPKKGTLIYIKASMNGHEDTAVQQYKATHPAFPHESTGNQFYDDDQFESYRSLGRAVVNDLLDAVMWEAQKNPNWAADAGMPLWLKVATTLQEVCVPDQATVAQFTNHANKLIDIWQRLGSDAALALFDSLDAETIRAHWRGVDPPAEYRPVYYLCLQLIQLMENVYLELALDDTWKDSDHSGWRNAFLHWASRPALQRTWELSGADFGLRFQHFCRRRLGLKAPAAAVASTED